MKNLVRIAALLESVTGLALIIDPALVARLLLGQEVSGAGEAMSRIAGISLFALGWGWWPDSRDTGGNTSVLLSILVYNFLAAVYLTYLGARGALGGILLWPATATHAVLTFLFGRALLKNR